MKDNEIFLGCGWSFPPEFVASSAVISMVSGEEDIKQSLRILFTTAFNERIAHADYGSELSQFVHEELSNGLLNKIRHIVQEAILYHESRIDVNDIHVTIANYESPLLLIEVIFTIRETNTRSNLVYPFHINEANGNFN